MALKGQKYLDHCKIFDNLESAIFDCDLVIASCGRIDVGKDSFLNLLKIYLIGLNLLKR